MGKVNQHANRLCRASTLVLIVGLGSMLGACGDDSSAGCITGATLPCECCVDGVCTPGTQTCAADNFGACICNSDGGLPNDAGTDVALDAPSDGGTDACMCADGMSETRATRNCGEETRTCASCTWGAWSESMAGQDEPECLLGEGLYEEENRSDHRRGCDFQRYRFRFCGTDCRWEEEYSECSGGCPGERRIEPAESEEICLPGGTFGRGCESDELDLFGEVRTCAPRHDVYLSAFYVDRHEVTVGRYQECVEAGACEQLEPTEPFPVIEIIQPSSRIVLDDLAPDNPAITVMTATYEQAEAFCTWDNARLLTGAEWERMSTGIHDHLYIPWSEGDRYTCSDGACWSARNHFDDGDPRWEYDHDGRQLSLGIANEYWFFEWTSELAGTAYTPRSPPEIDPRAQGDGPHELRGGSIFLNPEFQRFDIASRAPTRDSGGTLSWLWDLDHGAIRCGRTAREGDAR